MGDDCLNLLWSMTFRSVDTWLSCGSIIVRRTGVTKGCHMSIFFETDLTAILMQYCASVLIKALIYCRILYRRSRGPVPMVKAYIAVLTDFP